jgi:hypothetical protein
LGNRFKKIAYIPLIAGNTRKSQLEKERDALISLTIEQRTVIQNELNLVIAKSAWKNRIWTIVIGAI